MYSMRKILVIGCPGSGKSVFSIKLSEKAGIPVYHLDNLKWNPDGTTVDKPLFLKKLEEVLEKESWIIDGNYGSTMEKRMKVCDTIIFLDYDLKTCLEGVNSRRGTKRPDMPWVELKDHVDEDFLDFIRNYEKDSKPKVLKLLKKHGDKVIMTFKDRDEASEFLETLE